MGYCIVEILWVGTKDNSVYIRNIIQSPFAIRSHLKIILISPSTPDDSNRRVLVRFGIFLSSKPYRVGLRKIPCNIDIAQDHHDRSGVNKIFSLEEREVPCKIDFAQAVKLEEFLAGVDDDEVVGDVYLEVREVVERVYAVLDEVGVEWTMKFAVVSPD